MLTVIKVACAQQKVRFYSNDEGFKEDVFKFMAGARRKGCGLIVYPEGIGALLASQYLPRPIEPSQDLTAAFLEILAEHGEELKESYIRIFSEGAKIYGIYVVAGSTFISDEKTGRIVNAAYFFDPDGRILGYQVKIQLFDGEKAFVAGGKKIKVFETDFGKLGITICYDAMFPEVSRIMALKGAESIVTPSACPGPLLYWQVREGKEHGPERRIT